MKKSIVLLMVLTSLASLSFAGQITLAYRGLSTNVTNFNTYELSGGSIVATGTATPVLSSFWTLSGMASGDCDGDGITEAYYSYQNGSETRFNVWQNSQSFSTFASATTYGLATTDVNGDGISEACYIGLSGTRNAYAQNTNRTMAMTVNDVIDTSYTMYNTTAGDLDGDGVANDFAFMLRSGNDYLRVMDSDGNILYNAAVVNSTYSTAVGVTSGNFSNDSADDGLAYVYSPNTGLTGANKVVFKDSTFATTGSFDILSETSTILDVAAGDLDDDGIAEIVLAYRAASNPSGNVSLMVCEVDGTILANTILINGASNSFAGMTVDGTSIIPEPATMALLGMGAVIGIFRKKRV